MDAQNATAPDPDEIEGRAECCRLGADNSVYGKTNHQFQADALPDETDRFQSVLRLTLLRRAEGPSYPRCAKSAAKLAKWRANRPKRLQQQLVETVTRLNKGGQLAGPVPLAAIIHGKRGLQLPSVPRGEYSSNIRLQEEVRAREDAEGAAGLAAGVKP